MVGIGGYQRGCNEEGRYWGCQRVCGKDIVKTDGYLLLWHRWWVRMLAAEDDKTSTRKRDKEAAAEDNKAATRKISRQGGWGGWVYGYEILLFKMSNYRNIPCIKNINILIVLLLVKWLVLPRIGKTCGRVVSCHTAVLVAVWLVKRYWLYVGRNKHWVGCVLAVCVGRVLVGPILVVTYDQNSGFGSRTLV